LQNQYTAVYEALLEALTVSDTAIDKDTFCRHLDSHKNKPIAKNQTLLWLEFQVQHITSLLIHDLVIVTIPTYCYIWANV
jgi:hypothetical protein